MPGLFWIQKSAYQIATDLHVCTPSLNESARLVRPWAPVELPPPLSFLGARFSLHRPTLEADGRGLKDLPNSNFCPTLVNGTACTLP